MKTLNDLYVDSNAEKRAEIDSYFDRLYNVVNEVIGEMEQALNVTSGPHLKAFMLDMERVIGKDMISYE